MRELKQQDKKYSTSGTELRNQQNSKLNNVKKNSWIYVEGTDLIKYVRLTKSAGSLIMIQFNRSMTTSMPI